MAALIMIDGFDKYGPTGNQNATSIMIGDWFSVTGGSIVAPLSSAGYAYSLGSAGAVLTSNPLGSLTRIAGSFRFMSTTASTTGGRVSFQNSGTAVFAITLNSTSGAIELRTGGSTGTIITSGGSVALNTTHVIAFDITVGATGAYAVYLDGALLFSGTGNTGNGQTSLNTVFLSSVSAVPWTIDDFALFNPADAAYNAAVLTNSVVVETSFPSGDAQKQFTNDGNVLWPTGIAPDGAYQATSGQMNVVANSLFLLKFTPVVNCTLNSVSVGGNTLSLSTSKWRGVVYSDSSGSPSTLLSSGTELVGVTANTTFTLPLTTPQALTAGTPVWLGFIVDTLANNLKLVDASNLGRRIANTYTSGAPGTAGAMTAGQGTCWMWGNCTGAASNYASEMLNPPLGTAQSQIHSATVAQEDLYTFPALATTPSAIYGVAVKGFLAKSDSGARTVSLNMKSGASDSTGSSAGQAMSTTNQWQRSFFDTDPATGVAWTRAGLNAASSGVSVAS